MTKFKQSITRLNKFTKKHSKKIDAALVLILSLEMFYHLHIGDLLQALYSFLTVTVFIGISILLELMEINQRGGR